MDKAQYEFEQLIITDGIDNELTSHPELQKQFIHKYNFLTDNGNIPAKVSYNQHDKSIVIEIDKEYPNATNGIYQGYSSYTICTLGIEYKNDKPYFCVRQASSSIYHFPTKEDEHIYSSQLDVYENNLHSGKIEYLCSQKVMQGYNKRIVPNIVPSLEIGYALQGSVPQAKLGSDIYDWRITSKGIYNGYPAGITTETTVSNTHRNGNQYERQYEESSRLITISKENPNSLDYVGTVIATMPQGKYKYELFSNSQFNNLDDAIAYYANECSEYVPSNSGKSR